MSIYLGQCVCRAVAIRFEVVRFVVRVLVLCSQTPGESLATQDYACVRLWGWWGRGGERLVGGHGPLENFEM